MSEHKYRAWHKTKQEMLSVVAIYFVDDCVDAVFMLNTVTGEMETYPAQEIDLLEWTGHNDKKGTPIYEGDISIRNGNNNYRYKAAWSDTYAKWAWYGFFRSTRPSYIALTKNLDRVEVIGNIYEHPSEVRP